MEWINVNEGSEIPTDKSIIVEDCNGWTGQAYKTNGGYWALETFGQGDIVVFDTIVRYMVLEG